jgi:xanthosine utilization system XapX-like protein
VPPSFEEAVARVKAEGLAGALYTSHSHVASAPRYRIVLPLSAPIAPALPAPEVIAELLGLLGVLDMTKIGASSLLYLPSAEPGKLVLHEAAVLEGEPIDAAWMAERAGAILAEREVDRQRQRDIAQEAATRRREDYGRLLVLGMDDIDSASPRGYLLKGLLSPAEISIWVGPPKCGKSFLLLHVAYMLSLGRSVFGRKVK